jgi:arylsulfatase
MVLPLVSCTDSTVVEGEPACRELAASQAGTRASIVLIVNDTMRRDRVGIYGGLARTPVFDAFARANLFFRNAYTQAPWTRPAIASLFTGLMPSQHEVGMEVSSGAVNARALADPLATLAELFHDAGYRTAAFISNPWMDRRFGFQQGFDTYDDSFARWGASGNDVSDAALQWLATIPREQPFFLYVHYLDSHRPYPALRFEEIESSRERRDAEPPTALSQAALNEIRANLKIEGTSPLTRALIEPSVTLIAMAYEKGIERFDAVLAHFLEGFARRPDSDRAAVVITSDHGEALYERGYGNHGQGLHDDELAVPLVMRLPGVRGPTEGVSCVVGLVDVLPTLCSYTDVACPQPIAGRSMLAADPSDAPRFLIAEAVGSQPSHRAIRTRDWKLIWEPGVSPSGPREDPHLLYDLASDPGEQRDLWSSDDPRARAARERLAPLLRAELPKAEGGGGRLVPVDEDLENRLRHLGYTQ